MGYIPLKPTVVNGATIPAQALSATGTALSFSTFSPVTNIVAFQVFNTDAYCTLDGTTPSSSNGARLYADQAYHWDRTTAQRAKFVGVLGGPAKIYAQECVSALFASELPSMEIWKATAPA